MAAEPRRIRADQKTELSDVLAEASKAPVLVEKDGVVYRVSPEPDDLWTGYDAAAVRAALHRYADFLTPEEGKQRIAAIYSARDAGSREVSRP